MTEAPEGKVYDTEKGWIDPAVKTDDPTPAPTPDPVPEKEEVTPAEAAAKVAEEVKAPETNIKKDELPAWLKEKYGIESTEDLQEVLESNSKLADELEKERDKKVFKSEKEEKLHKFLNDYDLDKIGEGMQTAATLLSLDIDGADPRKALEEAYIIENTDLTREEAKHLFTKEYRKKYELNKDKFDSDEEYEEEKKYVEIQLKKDTAKAKRILTEKKESLKVKETKAESKAEAPVASIEGYTKQVDKFFEKFEKLTETDEDGKELYSVSLNENQRKQVRDAMHQYVKRTDVYDKSGKINNFDTVELAHTFSEILFGSWLRAERNKQIKILAHGLKAEQIAQLKPDKVSKSQGKAAGMSLDEQFAERAKVEKAKRESAR